MNVSELITCSICKQIITYEDLVQHPCISLADNGVKMYLRTTEDGTVLVFESTSTSVMTTSATTSKSHLLQEDCAVEEANKKAALEEMFVLDVQQRPALWNYGLPVSERTPQKINALWLQIVDTLPEVKNVNQAKAMWKSLRDQYMRDKKKVNMYRPSGSGADDLDTSPSFRLYKQMTFLDDVEKTKERYSNVSVKRPVDAGAASSKRQKLTGKSNVQDALIQLLDEPKTSDGVDGFSVMIAEILRKFTFVERTSLQTEIISFLHNELRKKNIE